ncbi:hypothetical protein [Streptomyces sp. NPDC001315]|uniref:hypothetical protein n=1 Tax=Streptomyces sp. NPDC001315 TaxID=3364562 RepID=UPI00368C1E9B
MVPATHAAHIIEVTAESLQEDLARLEVQKHALERELAAVVAHLDSVQRALSARVFTRTTSRFRGGAQRPWHRSAGARTMRSRSLLGR